MKKIAIATLLALTATTAASVAYAGRCGTTETTAPIGTVSAQDCERAGAWSVGAGVGYSRFHNEDLSGTGVSQDDNDTGWKIFAGYQFHRNFALEGGYVDLGRTTADVTLAGGSASEKIEASGPFLDVLAILPLNNGFSIYGRVGGIYAKVKDSFNSTGTGTIALAAFGLPPSGSDDKSKLALKAGVGAQFDFNSSLGVRAEWERYFRLEGPSGDKGDVDLFSVNGVFSF